IGDVYLPCHDPDHGETIGIKFDHSKLFKHPLRVADRPAECGLNMIMKLHKWEVYVINQVRF
ncbi:MAG: hypothetical protein V7L04_17070, partial [Nostoc sp.]|uniref:hypothetical protein n=1 Tax=Nostoc sp. TaxID=1180 RepID=UPI002FF4C3CA